MFVKVFLYYLLINYSFAQDVSVFIDTKRIINIVDEKFISIVIDPLLLLHGLNISSDTFLMGQNLSPALVRIQGFSTNQLSFSPDLISHSTSPDDVINFRVTPAMWTSLNKWLINAKLTPVFAFSDRDRINDTWNPKSMALPLMEIADKLNLTCYWEISSDIPNKSLQKYTKDVLELKQTVDSFSNNWKISGGELTNCILSDTSPETIELDRMFLTTIENSVDSINWTPSKFLSKISTPTIFSDRPSIWTTAPRNSLPISFKDGLNWAKYLGQAAVNGYNVIFRQPKLQEFSKPTPSYWISWLHKMLMGSKVVDCQQINYNVGECNVYAHCKQKQLTIFSINGEQKNVNIDVKLFGFDVKNIEVQSYILTSVSEESSETYLNGNPLTISALREGKLLVMPKIVRVRSWRSLSLNLPAKSIGFFVIPDVYLSSCDQHNSRPENQLHSQENSSDFHADETGILNKFDGSTEQGMEHEISLMDQRDKRGIVSFEFPDEEMEEVARKTRHTPHTNPCNCENCQNIINELQKTLQIIQQLTNKNYNHLEEKEISSNDITIKRKRRETSDRKVKILEKKLARKEKLEKKLNSYLNKIKKSSTDLRDRLQRNSRSIRSIQTKIEAFDSDSISETDERTISDNRTTKFNKIDIEMEEKSAEKSDRTKEEEIYRNEISKEGKHLPNFIKEIEEDIYFIKPIKKDQNILNSISKEKIPQTSSSMESKIQNKNQHEDENESKNNDDENKGLIDNIFNKMFSFMQEFHKKIISYVKYLGQ